MSDWDRQLIELITDLDANLYGVCELRELVQEYGAERVIRVITDGIGAVVRAEEGEVLDWDRERQYVSLDEAVRLAQLEPVPIEYRVVHFHETLEAQNPGLLFRYAADDPAAVAEVRSRAGLE